MVCWEHHQEQILFDIAVFIILVFLLFGIREIMCSVFKTNEILNLLRALDAKLPNATLI